MFTHPFRVSRFPIWAYFPTRRHCCSDFREPRHRLSFTYSSVLHLTQKHRSVSFTVSIGLSHSYTGKLIFLAFNVSVMLTLNNSSTFATHRTFLSSWPQRTSIYRFLISPEDWDLSAANTLLLFFTINWLSHLAFSQTKIPYCWNISPIRYPYFRNTSRSSLSGTVLRHSATTSHTGTIYIFVVILLK